MGQLIAGTVAKCNCGRITEVDAGLKEDGRDRREKRDSKCGMDTGCAGKSGRGEGVRGLKTEVSMKSESRGLCEKKARAIS